MAFLLQWPLQLFILTSQYYLFRETDVF